MSRIYDSMHLLSKKMHFFHKGIINNFGIKSRNFHASTYSLTKYTIGNENDILTKEKANIFINRLSTEEKYNLINALNTHISQNEKYTHEGDQLEPASWRNKFGKFTKLPNIKDENLNDGYPNLPTDQHKTVKNDSVPTAKDLLRVAYINGTPFIVFGFLDNAIMILAGDAIEKFFSSLFLITTMAAAALGNTISDIVGVLSSSWVENFVRKLGFKTPNLTEEQLRHLKTKLVITLSRVLCITIGCLIGMIAIPCVDYLRNR